MGNYNDIIDMAAILVQKVLYKNDVKYSHKHI